MIDKISWPYATCDKLPCDSKYNYDPILFYRYLCNNHINARSLIGQSAMVYCADKLMRIFRIVIG